ncbi:hypothetical protein KSF_027780 [Reticulibacter mediterranei]|uniref:Orc1-like AAA ATPase domain-containing protein n=1 Tax=Reticulibacter mediterranei TaxID=2778369 RepID=A0A8J3IL46_9CHLR|nr:ATP-binding protein [Reticulibacter mediterranei]GHO92730.1 hypothetical protein KSF_027780 [Reticulibacter mediterranei]
MQRWKQFWRYWYYEPLIWLLRCFFQPAGFRQDIEVEQFSQRMFLMLRLVLPMLSWTYPLALLIRVILYATVPAWYPDFHIQWSMFWQSDVFPFVFETTWQAVLGCLAGGFLGGMFGLVYGIAFGLAFSLGGGIVTYDMPDLVIAAIIGLILGLILGLTFNSGWVVKRGGVRGAALASVIVAVGSMVMGVAISIFPSYWVGLVVDCLHGPGLLGAIIGAVIGGLSAIMLIFVVGAIIRTRSPRLGEAIDMSIRAGIAVAGALGASVGLQVGAVAIGTSHHINDALASGESNGLMTSAIFFCGYLFSYYRLPLYPFDALSLIKSYLLSQREPALVFYHLKHCALHCDEVVFLPLPYVRALLLIAATQNVEVALEEIDFIVHERSQQSGAARAAALEIALFDLSMRESLRDISHVHQRLSILLPVEIRQADPLVARVFRHIEDASRDAVSYYARLKWQARYDALESMKANLKRIYPLNTFRETALNRMLDEVVHTWNTVALREQEYMERSTDRAGQIENPYTPGLVLERHDPLFVGRKDLAHQLSDALRRSRRPTFFLTGERRMGKSSILKQLPDLLGSHYLPVFYDLQSTGIASSIAALLAAIAEGIYELLITRGMLIKELSYEQLKEDLRDNEAVVYHRFGRWLKEVERVLEREDHVLLLAFDEFEKLEEAGGKQHLDLALLLDWFRSIIQNHSRVALLFSGVKIVSDMGGNWAGYFVNVETLRVSFLHPDEARQLIVEPLADFPGTQVFAEPVVSKIMQMTRCHPFLTQAICSIIITNLNATTRIQAELADVTNAVEELFQKWGDYFRDMWDRTDAEQRRYIRVVQASGNGMFAQIQEDGGLDEAATRRALQKLLKRDLLSTQDGQYHISMPIFAEWIERYSESVS